MLYDCRWWQRNSQMKEKNQRTSLSEATAIQVPDSHLGVRVGGFSWWIGRQEGKKHAQKWIMSWPAGLSGLILPSSYFPGLKVAEGSATQPWNRMPGYVFNNIIFCITNAFIRKRRTKGAKGRAGGNPATSTNNLPTHMLPSYK